MDDDETDETCLDSLISHLYQQNEVEHIIEDLKKEDYDTDALETDMCVGTDFQESNIYIKIDGDIECESVLQYINELNGMFWFICCLMLFVSEDHILKLVNYFKSEQYETETVDIDLALNSGNIHKYMMNNTKCMDFVINIFYKTRCYVFSVSFY